MQRSRGNFLDCIKQVKFFRKGATSRCPQSGLGGQIDACTFSTEQKQMVAKWWDWGTGLSVREPTGAKIMYLEYVCLMHSFLSWLIKLEIE